MVKKKGIPITGYICLEFRAHRRNGKEHGTTIMGDIGLGFRVYKEW